MQEGDECCRWNWTVGHRGFQRWQTHTNTQCTNKNDDIIIFSFKTHVLYFFDRLQILNTLTPARPELNERVNE